MYDQLRPLKRKKMEDDSKYHDNQYIYRTEFSGSKETSIITFSLTSEVDTLATVFNILRSHNVNIHHIESRLAHNKQESCEVVITCGKTDSNLQPVIEDLSGIAQNLSHLTQIPNTGNFKKEIPWFPRRMKDFERYASPSFVTGAQINSDHPGFTDPVYRKRRNELSDIALHYKPGQPIPRVNYTATEIETWRTAFKALVHLYPTHACRQFNQGFSVLEDHGILKEDTIPQLQDVSDFLKACTGFQILPATGFRPFREFLAGLAFRVFRSTQYLRHNSKPKFTPEPDLIHEILGHVPMLVDPDFAQFMQDIGLASLGASDEDMKKLASLLWFTLECGVCREGGQIKAYGAALLSSFGELEYCLSGQPELRPLEFEKVYAQDYPITCFQQTYFVADRLEDIKVKFRKFISTMSRPFNVRYDPYTKSVKVISKRDHVINLTQAIKDDLSVLEDALIDANN